MHLVSPNSLKLHQQNASNKVLDLIQFFLESHPRNFDQDLDCVKHLRIQIQESELMKKFGTGKAVAEVMQE